MLMIAEHKFPLILHDIRSIVSLCYRHNIRMYFIVLSKGRFLHYLSPCRLTYERERRKQLF